MVRANVLVLLQYMIYHDLISTDLKFGFWLDHLIPNNGSGHSGGKFNARTQGSPR